MSAAGRPLMPRVAVAAVGLFTFAVAAWGALQWTLVPVAVHSRIVAVEYQSESGYRWRILRLQDGRALVIDRRITNQLGDWSTLGGQTVDKRAWEHTLTVGDRQARLAPSVELWKVVATVGAVVAFAVIRAGRVERAEPDDLSSGPGTT